MWRRGRVERLPLPVERRFRTAPRSFGSLTGWLSALVSDSTITLRQFDTGHSGWENKLLTSKGYGRSLRRACFDFALVAVSVLVTVNCGSAVEPLIPTSTRTPVPTPQGRHVSVDLHLSDGTSSELTAGQREEFEILITVDTNGELVTAGDATLGWDHEALVARGFLHGDLIGSSPLGLYELTGAGNAGQGELHYQVHDSADPDITPPGILARFRFKVGDGSLGMPTADGGDYTIVIGTGILTDDRTPPTSGAAPGAALKSRFEGASYETYLRNASVVVHVAK